MHFAYSYYAGIMQYLYRHATVVEDRLIYQTKFLTHTLSGYICEMSVNILQNST